MSQRLISVVIPVFNEQENLSVFYNSIKNVFESLLESYEYELIFVDDGSHDDSWKIIERFAKSDFRVRAISFSRNFGHQLALKAGYDIACGDAIVSIDSDMQHQPQLIIQMLKKWENGALIVYARKVNRKDNFLKRISAFLFYKLLDFISDVKIPHNVSDFRLIDKKVLNVLLDNKEKFPFFRGLVAWTGFTHAFVDCQYFKRHAGKSGYSWKKMFQLAWDGITRFSRFPLKISAIAGSLIVFFSIIVFLFLTYSFMFGTVYGISVWLINLCIFFVGGQFLSIWLLGEYVARIYQQQSERPIYLIEKKIGKEFYDHYNAVPIRNSQSSYRRL